MKKMIALILAAVMMLACLPAVAEESAPAATTVNISIAVEKEELKSALSNVAASETFASVEPVLDLLNALTIKAVIAQGVQIDLNVGETTALSLGGAATEDGLVIGSSLIPSYLVSIPAEQLQGMLQQFMPAAGAGAEGGAPAGMDMSAIGESIGKYAAEFTAAFQTAVVPGEAEFGSWEFEGYTFDVKTPHEVDEMALAEAVKKLVNGLLTDEAVKGMLASIPNFNAEEILKSLDEAMTEEHIPDVKVDVYGMNKEDANAVYTVSEATYKGEETPAYTFTMLSAGADGMKMTVHVAQSGVDFVYTMVEGSMQLDVIQGEAYIGFNLITGTEGFTLAVLSAPDKAALILQVGIEQGGEITLPLDPEGKTVLTLADLQGGNASEAMQGLSTEAMISFSSLMQIPEVAQLMAAMTPKAPTEETTVETTEVAP